MNKIDAAIKYISDTLTSITNNDMSDVQKIHLYAHYIESILISLMNANRIGVLNNINENYSEALSCMTKLGLLSDEIIAFWFEHKEIIQESLDVSVSIKWDDPHYIHENLLMRELNISNQDINFLVGKSTRDTMGSYYTPNDFAIQVVREAIEIYLKIHDKNDRLGTVELLSNAKFADLSCGCGEFIKAIQQYLYKQYKIDPVKTCTNLYGVDIDPIALQITICDLLQIAEKSKWIEIITHFTLGNPLINQTNEKCINEKTRLFATKRYYAPDMGININCLFNNNQIDIIVGNPPWEKIRFEERKFFQTLIPEISAVSQKNKRKLIINRLKEKCPDYYDWHRLIANDYTCFKKDATIHPLLNYSISGELNTYVLFAELSLNLISNGGVISLIVKSAIATSPANKTFFNYILTNNYIISICLFNNSLRIFDIDSRERFCVITCTKNQNRKFHLIAGACKTDDLHSMDKISLSSNEVNVINPNTHMIPNISNNEELSSLLEIHKRLPLFDEVFSDCHFGRLVHLTSHSEYIDTKPSNDNIPIYEGKFIERYDARFATFNNMQANQKYSAKAQAKRNPISADIKSMPESRYFIKKALWTKLSHNYTEAYMLCWRSLTSPTNKRTTLAMLLPTTPTCQSIQFLQTKNKKDLLIMLALFNSKSFDYFVRLKMPGIDLTQSVIKQIPVPKREIYTHIIQYKGLSNVLEQHIIDRVSLILSKEPLVSPILNDICYLQVDLQERPLSSVTEELDDLFFIAYGFNKLQRKTILANFKN